MMNRIEKVKQAIKLLLEVVEGEDSEHFTDLIRVALGAMNFLAMRMREREEKTGK